jgi:serine/threonine protein kinase/tetratricopeptide (TPR) repeat protein
MAIVYKAIQHPIQRQVAIKLINGEYAEDPNFQARFEREARTIANLSHPHLLKLFDFGQHEGTPYLVMELFTGGTLSDLIRRERLTLAQVDKLLTQIASALDYAHKTGIVHRDLKPSNVLLDQNGNAILTDFGLAKVMSRQTRATETGAVMGTSDYMSPEQWKGEPATAQSDVYALGVMVFEMLTGETPFQSDSWHGLLYAHLNTTPPLEKLPAEWPQQIKSVLSVAMAKQAVTRFESAGAFAEAFHNAIQGKGNILTTQPNIHLELIDSNMLSNMTTLGKTDTIPPTEQLTRLQETVQQQARISKIALISVPILAVVMLLVVLIVPRLLDANRSNTAILPIWTPQFPGEQPPPGYPTPPPMRTRPPTRVPLLVEPVKDGELMVLVARFEKLGGADRDVPRFISDDLRQQLEPLPFSTMRVRTYPNVIQTPSEAVQIAKHEGATVIVWGNYDDKLISVQVQLGTFKAFKYLKFSEELVRRTSDVRVQMTDPRSESLAVYVLHALQILAVGDGDSYESLRTLVLAEQMSLNSPPVIGDTIAPRLLRNLKYYLTEPETALSELNKLIQLDGGNAILYAYRGTLQARLGNHAESLTDYNTARRIGPENWAFPDAASQAVYVVMGDYKSALEMGNRTVGMRPTDWFPIYFRGALYYLLKDFEAAGRDAQASIALTPTGNFPYLLQTALAIRAGDFDNLAQNIDVVLKKFPDPAFTTLITNAAYGNKPTFIGLFVSGGNKIFLAQFEDALIDLNKAIELDSSFVEAYLMKGVALCNLGRYVEAEEAATEVIKREPKIITGYLLRAVNRYKQGGVKLTGALFDVTTARGLNPPPSVQKLLDQGIEGNIECDFNFTPKPLSLTPTVPATPAR